MAWLLNFDDFRAHVAQEHSAIRTGEYTRQINYPQPG